VCGYDVIMSSPQQPELRRSGRGDVTQEGRREAREAEEQPASGGRTGPVRDGGLHAGARERVLPAYVAPIAAVRIRMREPVEVSSTAMASATAMAP
jgi:hypothetical protein